MLGSGLPVKVNDLKDAAAAHGLSWTTVERAKKEIATIDAERDGKGWAWRKKGEGLMDY